MAKVLVVRNETETFELPVATIEEAKSSLVNQAKFFGTTLDFAEAKPVGTDQSMIFILPNATIYRMTVVASKATTAKKPSGSKKSKELEYAADKVYVQAVSVKVQNAQKWAFITRLKADEGDAKAGKSVKLIESLRMSIYREVGKGNFYFNSFTDQDGTTLNEPRWVVGDSRKADVMAKLAEAGIEVMNSQ